MATPLSFDDHRPGAPRSTDGGNRDASGGRGGAAPFLALTGAGAALGAVFSAISTTDFIAHLDRQVHGIHCSFVPGAAAELGESGCRTVMMSPFSSMFRESMWGGLPIALLSFAVFAYLVMKSAQLFLSGRVTRTHTTFMLAATFLPVLMSIVYGTIAVKVIGAVCTLCVGVYVSSAVAFLGALMAHVKAERGDDAQSPAAVVWGRFFLEGVIYVVVMVGLFMALAPTSPKSTLGCEPSLNKREDSAGVFIPLGPQGAPGSTPAIELLDPLCPACKGFAERLDASKIKQELSLQAVLFPLDDKCNWMVKEAIHPGACAVSEALLCDAAGAPAVLAWAFANQEELRTVAKEDDAKIRARIVETFPALKACLGTPAVKNKLNKSLRFAVDNALPVLTPQLFVGDTRVCDEDTDLGLEFAVRQMLDAAKAGK